MGRSHKFPMQKSKILALFLTLVLSIGTAFSSIGSTTVQAATAHGTWGSNITWTFKNGTLTISGKGAMRDTPRKFVSNKGWIYTTLCSTYKDKITKVIIEEGVTAIGDSNFYHWYPNIKTVVLPSTMRTIGNFAFHIDSFGGPYEDYEKSKLKNINFPQGLKTIGEYAFSDCVNLTSISLPNSVKTIKRFAFSGCVKLTSIDLPSSIETIEDFAFSGCTRVTTTKIHNKNCKIKGYYSLPPNTVVYGHKNSTAEAYITDYLRTYIPGSPAHASQFRTLASAPKVKVKSVKITNAPKSLKAGKSIKLKAKITPASATNKKLTWSSSNPKYATVNQSGKVTAKPAGKGKTIRITVKTKDGSNKKHTVKIKIT